MKKVTVAIATYNMAGYLREALDSALSQDHPDFEVVVLDDGSTDDTLEVVRGYGGRVRYYQQENAGVAVAYNRLLELARGEYVHHLDADDILTPGTLRRLANLLDGYPSVGLAYGDSLVTDSKGRVTGTRPAPASFAGRMLIPSEEAFKSLLNGCHITTSAVMLRKSVLKNVTPFRQKSVPGEDWDMWLRVAAAYDIGHIPFSACYYRVHGTSITSAYTAKGVLRSHLYTLDTIFGNPTFRYGYMRDYAYSSLDRTVARVALRSGDRGRFLAEMRNAFVRRPSMVLEGETLGVFVEAAKSLVPNPLLEAGKRVRRGLTTRWSPQ